MLAKASARSGAGAEIKSDTESGLRCPRVRMALILPSVVYISRPSGFGPQESRTSPLSVVIFADTNFQVPTNLPADCACVHTENEMRNRKIARINRAM